jgi:ATP-dependent exoDNAse (exonuclease V) alpha subunit
VERVTYHNLENGFCVLRVKARGQRDLVPVIGHAAMINPGEFISATGWWTTDREHGLQFKASHVTTTQPTTREGIEKYLGSGMIRGIGPVYARALVRAFGDAVLDLIEREPQRLREVTGIGVKRAARIVAGWADQKATVRSCCSCTPMVSAPHVRCGFSRPTARRQSPSSRRTPIGWPETFAASAFAPPIKLPPSSGSRKRR